MYMYLSFLLCQVSPRACHWLRVVENVLVWLSRKFTTNVCSPTRIVHLLFFFSLFTSKIVGQTHIISMTNLSLLFQNESQRSTGHRYMCSMQSNLNKERSVLIFLYFCFHRSRQHSTKFPDSKGCYRCCTGKDRKVLVKAQ